MLAAVVPAYNEEHRIGRVLTRLLSINAFSTIYVILNGSNMLTQVEAQTVCAQNRNRITLVYFREPLGIDVPRAIGAKLAYTAGALHVLFLDGDMIGEFTTEITGLIQKAVTAKLDLALLDCYPNLPVMNDVNEPMFYYRRLLNLELGLYDTIGIATPSHGPHLVSRRMLSTVPWEDFAVPPTLLTHAVLGKMKVGIAASIPHIQLGSTVKSSIHSQLIVDTISGDCLEALCIARHLPRQRRANGRQYLGYHGQRRFDLLGEFLAGRMMA